MSGPIRSNIQNLNDPMALVGMQSHGVPGEDDAGYDGGHAAYLPQQVYGNSQQELLKKRPFKCDQCHYSFHDGSHLTRHKQLHLEVKPFPCEYCEMSFARQDYLKVSFSRVD